MKTASEYRDLARTTDVLDTELIGGVLGAGKVPYRLVEKPALDVSSVPFQHETVIQVSAADLLRAQFLLSEHRNIWLGVPFN